MPTQLRVLPPSLPPSLSSSLPSSFSHFKKAKNKTKQNKQTSKTRQKCPDKIKWNKKPIKRMWSSFHVGQRLQCLEPAPQCGWDTQGQSIGENDFSLFQQVSIAHSFLVMGGTPCPFLLLNVGLAWTCVGFVLIVRVSMSLYVHQLSCLEDTILGATTSGSYNLSASSSARSLSLKKEGFHKDIRTEYSNVSHTLWVTQLWVSVLIPIYNFNN